MGSTTNADVAATHDLVHAIESGDMKTTGSLINKVMEESRSLPDHIKILSSATTLNQLHRNLVDKYLPEITLTVDQEHSSIGVNVKTPDPPSDGKAPEQSGFVNAGQNVAEANKNYATASDISRACAAGASNEEVNAKLPTPTSVSDLMNNIQIALMAEGISQIDHIMLKNDDTPVVKANRALFSTTVACEPAQPAQVPAAPAQTKAQ